MSSTRANVRTALAFLLCLLSSAWSVPAWAHSMHQTAVLLDFHGSTVGAELQLPVDRLSISFRQTVNDEMFPAERTALASYVLSHVHPVTADGRAFSVQLQSMDIETVEAAPYLVVHLLFTPPAGANDHQFTLIYDVITHEIVTHVVLVSIRSDDRHPVAANDPVLVGYLRGPIKTIVIDRSRKS